MICKSKPYEGEEKYIFVSYCHDDETEVYPIIDRLSIEGFRVWYDDGVHPGDDWPEIIAQHLAKSAVCVACLSASSTASHNCKNEVTFAVNNNKPIVSVKLENFRMPLAMQMMLSSTNFINKFDYEKYSEDFYGKFLCSSALSVCRSSEVKSNDLIISEWRKYSEEKYVRGKSPTVTGCIHELVKTEPREPKCTEPGNNRYWTCSICGKIFSDEAGEIEISKSDIIRAAKGHAWDEGIITKAPHENEDGTKVSTCLRCGAIKTEIITLAESAKHRSGPEPEPYQNPEPEPESEINDEATVRERYIPESRIKPELDQNAKHEPELKTEPKPEPEHEIDDEATVGARYSPVNRIKSAKNMCEDLGHDWDEGVPAPEDPEKTIGRYIDVIYTCRRCGKQELREKLRNSPHVACKHDLIKTDAKAAACTETGNIAFWTCSKCQKLYSDENGKNSITSEQTQIPAKGHDLIRMDAAEATCTAKGNNAYYRCTACGKLFLNANASEEIEESSIFTDELGHDWDEGVLEIPDINPEATIRASDLNISKIKYTCRRCGEIKRETAKTIPRPPAILCKMKSNEIFMLDPKSTRSVTIGRAEDNDITFFGNRSVSRHHAEIVFKNGNYFIREVSASFGTWVNGNKIGSEEDTELGEQSEIVLAEHEEYEQIWFLSGKAYERIQNDGKICSLKCTETGEVKIVIDDLYLDRSHVWRKNILGDHHINRKNHAQLTAENGKYYIIDLGSTHGTFLNGKKLKSGKKEVLFNGDSISLWETEFVYHEIKTGKGE